MSHGDRNPLGIGPNTSEANNLDNEWRNIMNRISYELEQNADTELSPDLILPTFGVSVSSTGSADSSQSFPATDPSRSRFVGLWSWYWGTKLTPLILRPL